MTWEDTGLKNKQNAAIVSDFLSARLLFLVASFLGSALLPLGDAKDMCWSTTVLCVTEISFETKC